MSDADQARMLRFVRMFGHRARVDAIRILADGARRADELAAMMRKRSVRAHLELLRRKGLLVKRGDRYALSRRVNVISTPKQHDFIFKFGEDYEVSMGLNVWKNS